MARKAEPPVTADESQYCYRRPRTRTIGPDGDRRDVREVSDVLRDICWDLIQDAGWTQTQLAEKSGIAQTTLNAFMSGDRDSGGILTALCAVLDCDPIDVLAQHPLYADHARSVIRTKDRLFQRFQRELRIDQARRFLRAIEAAKAAGRIESTLKILAEIVGLDLTDDGDGDASDARKPAAKPPKLNRVRK